MLFITLKKHIKPMAKKYKQQWITYIHLLVWWLNGHAYTNLRDKYLKLSNWSVSKFIYMKIPEPNKVFLAR